jgi:23S rRNA-/tRNA-specific pseudouridylate synthase
MMPAASPRYLSAALPATGAAPRIVHCDDWLLVVEKPAGLLAVPGRGPDKADCLSARLQALHPEALIVHRLDEATSGLMLFARHPEAQRRLSRAFERRAVGKRYVAVVTLGRPPRAAASGCRWRPTGRAGRCSASTASTAGHRGPTGCACRRTVSTRPPAGCR